MKFRRFHPLYSLHIVRKGLALCLLPMLRALLHFDWASLVLALQQDALILLLLLAFSFAAWQLSGWRLEGDLLTIQLGILFHLRQQVRIPELASAVVTRPFFFRLMGASRLTVYTQRSLPGSITLFLPRRDAEALARALMPDELENPVFAPVGADRLSMLVLGFNVTLTGLMAVYSARKTLYELDPFLTQTAWQGLLQAEALVNRVLPAGLAWLVTLAFLFYVFSLGYNFLCRANLRVARGDTILVARYGLLRLTERRVRLSAVTSCQVRVTPAARLLRRYPVYLAAGHDQGRESPLFLCRKGDWFSLRRLMPGLYLPPSRYESVRGRSLPSFFWFPAGGGALCLLLLILSRTLWPAYTFLFLFGLFFFGCLGLQAAEGYRREGVGRIGSSLTLCYTRRLTRYEVCVFTDLTRTGFRQNPFSKQKGRGTFTLKLPAARYRIRSVSARIARELPL